MLKSILSSNPVHTFILIEDDNSAKGIDLLMGVLKNDVENAAVRHIHLICYENPPEYYCSQFDGNKIIKYDFFSDPECWIDKSTDSGNSTLDQILPSEDNSSTVVIDSLNMTFLLEDFNHALGIIHNLKKQFKTVTCLFHGDVIRDNDAIRKIIFFSDIYMKIQIQTCNRFNLKADVKLCKMVEGRFKKSNGKIVPFRELYTVDSNCNVVSKVFESGKKEKVYENVKDSLKNITTFRLGFDIKENEKIARDNLVLPYVRTRSEQGDLSEKGSKIVYFADAGDDLEEDPDDDLDI